MPSKETVSPSLEWSVPEYTKHERGKRWYIIAAVVSLALIISALLTKNFLFAVLIVLFWFIVYLHDTTVPTTLTVRITDEGVELGDQRYPWSSFVGFWIVDNDDVKKLYLDFQGWVRPHLVLPLDGQEVAEVRAALKTHLREDTTRKDEPLADLLGRLFKL